jgi:hypothetical protein
MCSYKSGALNQLSYGIEYRSFCKIFKAWFRYDKMLWIGHLALGYLVFKLFSFLVPMSLTGHEQTILLAVALIASVLPDLDFIPFFIRNKSMKLQSGKSHREGFSHAPLFYTLIAAILLAIPFSNLFHMAVLVGLVSIIGHFIGDTIEYGVPWLWPFSSKRYALHQVSPEKISRKSSTIGFYWTFFVKIYVKNYTFCLDLLCVLAAAYLLLFS